MVYRSLYDFCIVFLSSIYLDILKDRMYTFSVDSRQRRSGQTVMYEIASSLVRMIAPIMPFTAEEAWGKLRKQSPDACESIHLVPWPKLTGFSINNGIESKYEKLIKIRQKVLLLLEEARTAKEIGSSLQAKVVISFKSAQDFKFFKDNESELPTIFIVSQAEVIKADPSTGQKEDMVVEIKKAEGTKCQRCWNYSLTVGKDKEHAGICKKCLESITKEGTRK